MTTPISSIETNPDATLEAILPGVRRPLIAAPSEGPVAYGLVSGDPSRTLGGDIHVSGDQGRAAPMLRPTPAPSPLALRYEPATYTNPNHYEFPHNLGGREARVPLASLPEGEMIAYPLRRDWRRPAPIEPAAVNPGSG